ncbi:MAG: YdcF family protein [Candidatus Saccharimonadales bacterium]
MHELVEQDVRTLWDYMLMHQTPQKADCLLVLGSLDDRVAVYAAELAKRFHYWYIVISGGGGAHHNDLLATMWSEGTEAEHFLAVMKRAGFAKGALLETAAQNTGDNAKLTFDLLRAQNTPMPLSLLLVTKPYMERRALATFQAQWPDHDATIMVTSPPIAYDDYFTTEQPREKVIHIMVGDMQRIMSYPALGYQSAQSVPAAVRAAYDRLIAAGYTKQLMND